MKLALIALCLSMIPLQAHAISRYTSTSMSCERVKSTIRQEGAVILRWTGRSGVPRYGRFVRSDRFCETAERAEMSSVPTRDRASCPVFECKQYSRDDDDFLFLRRGW